MNRPELFENVAAQPVAGCATCAKQGNCFARHLDADVLVHLEQTMTQRRVPRGSFAYRTGDPFEMLYFVRDGFFKNAMLDAAGQECIVAFPMAGDVMGLDGVADGRHNSQAVALQDSMVCELPYQSLLELSQAFPALQQSLHCMMSREIARNLRSMRSLGSLPAEQKLLEFLQTLSQQLAADDFNLPMSREEIASHLGLQMETVSRAFTKLRAEGLIQVQRRRVILDTARAA